MRWVWLAGIVLAASTATAKIIGDYNFQRTYPASAGPVTFLHFKHAERFPDECGFCHSALETFGGEVNELYAHKVCSVCHESHNGPTQCDECHHTASVSN